MKTGRFRTRRRRGGRQTKSYKWFRQDGQEMAEGKHSNASVSPLGFVAIIMDEEFEEIAHKKGRDERSLMRWAENQMREIDYRR